mmetsp:Transcript_33790/g.24834  ORF Transcript_33790/g.24834 Transcript_33790/m.24834 type:complete len:223 (+) Transcript_33790:177-845(+)
MDSKNNRLKWSAVSESVRNSEVLPFNFVEKEQLNIPDVESIAMQTNSCFDEKSQSQDHMLIELTSEVYQGAGRRTMEHKQRLMNAFLNSTVKGSSRPSMGSKAEECKPHAMGGAVKDWRDFLQEGNYFIKHNKWSKPKLRKVWVDFSLTYLYWSNSTTLQELRREKGNQRLEEKGQYRGRIAIKEIKSVKDGKGQLINPISKAFISNYQGRKGKIIALETKH